MTVEPEKGPRSLSQRLAILRALGDPVRAAVVQAIAQGPCCAEELAQRLGRPPSTLSFHLKKLEEASIVTRSRAQYYAVYELVPGLLELTLREMIASPPALSGERRLQKYRERVLATFMPRGVLEQMPKQWRKRVVVLREFTGLFEPGVRYEEKEVNRRITSKFEDYCTIRRMLIDEGMMARQGQVYWLAEEQPMESRSELKRKYKEAPREAGVFVITNHKNGRVYLGGSLNLHGSLNKHQFLLKLGNHWTRGLQEEWTRDGAESFTFEIVERVEPKDDPEFDVKAELGRMEQRWIQRTEGKRYNKGEIRE